MRFPTFHIMHMNRFELIPEQFHISDPLAVGRPNGIQCSVWMGISVGVYFFSFAGFHIYIPKVIIGIGVCNVFAIGRPIGTEIKGWVGKFDHFWIIKSVLITDHQGVFA